MLELDRVSVCFNDHFLYMNKKIHCATPTASLCDNRNKPIKINNKSRGEKKMLTFCVCRRFIKIVPGSGRNMTTISVCVILLNSFLDDFTLN